MKKLLKHCYKIINNIFITFGFELRRVNEIKNLIEETRKDASFSVSFWQNKNNDPTKVEVKEQNNPKDNEESDYFFKKWIKKIF